MHLYMFLKGITVPEDGKIPTKTDLEGFWDLVMLQVRYASQCFRLENIDDNFARNLVLFY